MGNGYHLLLIQDVDSDVSDIKNQLDKLKLDIDLAVVHQEEELISRIKDGYPGLVICDQTSSKLSGTKTLQRIREICSDLPVILIFDYLNDDQKVGLMQQGASDIIMKDYLGRLPLAVIREIQHYEQQQKREQRLSESLQRFQSLVQSVDGIVWEADIATYEFNYVSPQSKELLGYSPTQWYQNATFWKDHIHPDDRDQAVNYCHHQSKAGQNHSFEYRMLTADGGFIWLRDYVTIVKEDGEPSLLRGLMIDITETKFLSKIETLEKKLLKLAAQSSCSLQDIMDYFIDGIESLFPSMIPTILQVKDGRVFHWAASDRIPDRYLEAIDGEQIGPNAGSCGSAAYFNDKVIASDIDTDPRWKHYKQVALRDNLRACWSQALSDSSGNVMGTFAIYYQEPKEPTEFEEKVIDRAKNILQILIENKQSEQELKKNQQKLEKLSLVASKTTDVIIMTNVEGRITWVNDAFKELTGYTAEESLGKDATELLQGPETDPQTARQIDETVRKGDSIQGVILNYTKSGEKVWLDITVDPLYDEAGNLEGFIGVEKNVTQKIARKRKLQESVERYEIVSKATSDTIWDLDLEADTNRYNKNIYGMFGYNKEQVNERAAWWREKIHPDDQPQVIEKMEEALSSKRDRFQLEYRFECADGTYKFIYDRAFIVNDENGNPVRMIGAMQDVTRQKSEKKWLKLFESAISNTAESVAILESGPKVFEDKKILYVNDAFMKMTGYSWEEVVGENLGILMGLNTNQEELDYLDEAMKKGESVESELINYRKNGDEFWISASLAPVKDAEGLQSHWIFVGRNITERRERETELRDSLNEKEILLMEIHHRVKNNLAVVSGMMQLQAFEAEDEDLKQKLFDSVVRIKTMGSIHELLYKSDSFSKLDLDENIKQLISIITDTFKTNIELELDFTLEEVMLNINQAIPCSLIVNEVVTNVLKHAYNSDERGVLKVSLSEQEDMLHLNIEDNGCGLPNDFAATNSNSTSLGFKLIETLSNQLNADFKYESAEQGTLFELSFKRAEVKGIGSAHLE